MTIFRTDYRADYNDCELASAYTLNRLKDHEPTVRFSVFLPGTSTQNTAPVGSPSNSTWQTKGVDGWVLDGNGGQFFLDVDCNLYRQSTREPAATPLYWSTPGLRMGHNDFRPLLNLLERRQPAQQTQPA